MKSIYSIICLAVTCILLIVSSTVTVANTITTGTITPHTYCPGDSVMVPFTCTGVFTGANVFTAQLSNDTGQFISPVNIGTLTSTAAGTIHCMIPTNSLPQNRYRIRVIASAPATTGSTSVDSFTVYSNNFIPTISAFGPLTFCSGDSVVIYNVTGGNFTGFQWFRNGNPITGATLDHFAARLTGLYTLQLTTPCGTFTTATGVAITVNASPVMNISGDTIICIGSNAILQASGSNYQYSWSPANTLNQSNTALVSATPTTQTTYTVTGTNINGCTGTATHTVQVSLLPAVHAYTAHDTICLGASVTLWATGADIYSWSPSQTLNTSVTDTVIATPNGTQWYLVVGKNNACSPISMDSVRIVVVPASTVSITSNNDTICQGLSTTLTAVGANSYMWTPGNTLNDSTTATVIASPSSTTLYYVVGVMTGCNALDSFKVVVKPAPTITITGADTICQGNSTTLNASGAVNFIWSPYIGLVDSVSASEVANPTANVTYTVTGLGSNGCHGSGTFTLNVISCAGVNDFSVDNTIAIFPNPASDIITLQFNASGENISTVSVIDAKGTTVYCQAINKGNLPKSSIDLSNQPKGIYILKVATDKSTYQKKIVLE